MEAGVHGSWNTTAQSVFLRFLIEAFRQSPVVQKPVNANLGLKLNQGFWFSCYKAFALLIFGYSLKAVKVEF